MLRNWLSQKKFFCFLLLALIGFMLGVTLPAAAFGPQALTTPLTPQLSADGKALYGAAPAVRVVWDPQPARERIRIPAPDRLTDASRATAIFQVTYVPNGGTDYWDEPCYDWPAAAKAAVDRAAVIWGNILQSSVPITIRACWYQEDGTTLGYSGGAPYRINFRGAPQSNTWFQGSLANSLAGQDLDPDEFDMHIAMNRQFSWYYGLDANPPSNQVDFVTVMLHEIAHGLNFSGTMAYDSGSGQAGWGGGSGYPSIYDVFMYDGAGNQIVDTSRYPNPSTALGNAVTSNNLWWRGPHAIAANNGQRVKMYAPSSWKGGSSYSHVDEDTFGGRSNPNRLMNWRIANGDAIHTPGPVILGILRDMGWNLGGDTGQKAEITSPTPGSTLSGSSVTFSWTNVNARQYHISVGSVQGADNYFNQNAGTATSITATGLPVDGSTVHVRLYTTHDGSTWLHNDYTYKAYGGTTGQAAAITSPTPDTTLSGSSVTFSWTNVNARQYHISVGSTRGGYNYFNQNAGTATSITATGLPVDGRTLHVRLWTTHDGSQWLYNDYTYTAYRGSSLTDEEKAKLIFNWAEQQYRDYFPPGQTDVVTHTRYEHTMIYRYYSRTGWFLLTYNGVVYYNHVDNMIFYPWSTVDQWMAFLARQR